MLIGGFKCEVQLWLIRLVRKLMRRENLSRIFTPIDRPVFSFYDSSSFAKPNFVVKVFWVESVICGQLKNSR